MDTASLDESDQGNIAVSANCKNVEASVAGQPSLAHWTPLLMDSSSKKGCLCMLGLFYKWACLKTGNPQTIYHHFPHSTCHKWRLNHVKSSFFRHRSFTGMGQNPGTLLFTQKSWDLWMFIPLKYGIYRY